MTWQGIPYPLSNILESSYLTVSKIPTVVVDTGFAWENVLGSLIAGAIPAYIAWYTIKKNIKALEVDRLRQQETFDKDRAAQLDIASKNLNAQVLSNNRQQWINALRELMAEYLSLTSELLGSQHQFIISKVFYERMEEKHKKSYREGPAFKPSANVQEQYKEASRALKDSIKILSENRVKEKLLVSKIKMMLNPNESWYDEVVSLFADVTICYNSLSNNEDSYFKSIQEMYGYSDELLGVAQKILKYEWERVKLIV